MKTSEYPEGTGSLEIGIELALANNVTKSVRRLTQGGTLIFKNTSGQLLTIHSDNTPEPFVVPPSTTPGKNP